MKNILNRKNIFNTQSLTLLLIIIAILLVANFISANHFGRLDLTADKQYSISKTTKDTLKKLDDLLTIKVYFSQTLPPDLTQTAQYIKDVLSEYKAYSHKVNVEIIDPAKDETTKSEVESLGIPEIEMQIMEKDQFKVQKGYLGIAIFFGSKKEIIPIVQDVANIEYELTSAIKRLTSENLKNIGFLTGHDEHDIYEIPSYAGMQTSPSDYTLIKKELDKNYNVTTIDISSGQKIENIDTLIVAGPQKALSDREFYEIDQFLMRGGQAIFLLDQVTIAGNLQTEINVTGLDKLLSNYGIQVNSNLVMDISNETVGFSSGYMQFYLPYPFWPKLIKDNFAKDNPIMARLQTISLPWSSSLNSLDKEGVTTTVLATTTYSGSTVSQPFNLDPQQQYNPTERKKVPMIILAKGQFKSAYAGQKAPEINSENSENVSADKTIDQAEKEIQIIAVGDSDFINDDNLKRFPDNAVFFQNAVDYLTMGSDLISIRAKTLQDRPLNQPSETKKTWIKIINLIMIPLLVIVFGVFRFYQRKKNK
ncbi:MAG: hypothetical protein A2Y67_03385 [Candidatus Buchananbacteria bacterium RBG_13_39_9]|uniref:Uncharacterized protein n=1 Tax=Candidatus Buchananbacteria bacterium RBG_13_39_9 TaxID=1797531 RepID=A0A1G1XSG5_9BACT|nr:MAG: hypothetical protein A2Y67_03385 [Candidatus Buchananbacteria bacterium RBG_13_39_9]